VALSGKGVGAGKFLGVRRNFARIIPNLPKKYFKKSDVQKKTAFHVNPGATIFKSKHVGRHFCSGFQEVLEGSQRFCPDFHQIKTFGGAVASLPPTPVL